MLPATNAKLLEALGITHILSLTPYVKHPKGLQTLILAIDDSPDKDISALFTRANEYISAALAAGGTVLVHCMAGVSRSGSVVLAFLVSRGVTLDRALAHVRRCRPAVEPNLGFFEQLAAYECAQLGVAHPSVPLREYQVRTLRRGALQRYSEAEVRAALDEAGGCAREAIWLAFKARRKRRDAS